MSEERIELVFGVQGQGELAKAETAIEQTGKAAKRASIEVYEFADVYEVLEQQTPAVKKSLQAVDVALDEITRSADKAAVSVAHVGTAAVKTTEGAKNLGGGLQSVAFAAQDFLSAGGDISRGLFAIQNNIPMILTGLGATAGVAGAVSLASLAIGAMLPMIQKWVTDMDLFGKAATAGTDKLKTLKDRISELEKMDVKIPIDVIELEAARNEVERIEASLKEVKILRESRTTAEVESGKAIGGILEGAPGVGEDLRKQAIGAALAQSSAIKEAQDAYMKADRLAKDMIESELYPMYNQAAKDAAKNVTRVVNTITNEVTKKDGVADRMVGDIIRAAKTEGGAAQVEGQKRLREILTAAGRGELAGKVGEATPEFFARKEADKKLTDALTKQGEATETGALMELDRAKKEIADADAKRARIDAEDEAEGVKMEADAKTKQTQRQQVQQRRNREQMEGIKATSIDERAAAELAGMAAQGVSREQAAGMLTQQVGGAIKQAAPGLSRGEVMLLTSQVVEQAFATVDQQQMQQRNALATTAEMQGMQLNAGQLNMAATEMTLAALRGMIPQVRELQREAQRQFREGQRLAGTAMNTGGN